MKNNNLGGSGIAASPQHLLMAALQTDRPQLMNVFCNQIRKASDWEVENSKMTPEMHAVIYDMCSALTSLSQDVEKERSKVKRSNNLAKEMWTILTSTTNQFRTVRDEFYDISE